MTYPILALLMGFTSILVVASLLRWVPRQVCLIWLTAYSLFFIFGTGRNIPSADAPQYRLPWLAGQGRLVAQGNRSILSHRDLHAYAWDFVMPIGSDVLAARSGRVVEVEDSLDGIGLRSNYILIEHEDGEVSGYAHIQKNSASVKSGDVITQGQRIALSGMVGQTLFPHLHFYVFKKEEPVPISFVEAENPLPGRFYKSKNVVASPSPRRGAID